MVVAHPIAGFTGRVAVEEFGLAFVGGFTGPLDVPANIQTQLTAAGFTLNATPGADYGPKYVTHDELEDADSAASVLLRAAFALGEGAAPTDTVVASFVGTEGTVTRANLRDLLLSPLPVNVLQYGATGDGVTDDTAAVLAALAAMPTRGSGNLKTSTTYAPGTEAWEGGVLYFPAGVYLTTVDLSGRSNVTVRGDFSATVIKNTATDGSHAVKAINPAGSTKNRLVVRDLLVMGNPLSGDGIHFENVDYPLVHGVHAQENGRRGVHIFSTESGGPASGLENRIVSHLWSQWNGEDGLHLEGGHEILCSNLHLEENGRHGLYADNVTNFHLSSSSIEDNGSDYGLYLTQARQVDVVNVGIEGGVYWAPRTTQTYYARFTGASFSSFTASVLSGVSQYLMLNGCTGYVGGVGHTGSTGYLRLHASGCNLTVSELTGRNIEITGGTTVLTTKADTTQGLIQVTNSFTLNGQFTMAGAGGLKVQALAASAAFTIGTCRGVGTAGSDLTFSGNSQSATRFSATGLHSSSLSMIIDSLSIASLVGGVYGGTATLTLTGPGNNTKLSDLMLYASMAVVIDATRTGGKYVRGCDKDGTSTFTDNTAAAVKTDCNF